MTRGIGRLAIVGALCLAGAVCGTAGASAVAGTRTYTMNVMAGTTARTVRLDGQGSNLHLASVSVDRHKLVFGDGGGSQTATMYGDGVIVRFRQDGRHYLVSVVSIAADPPVSVTYTLSS